jgi:4-amino-4-deoxy-L-arabinose transferase-like glycosyltransferase
VAYALRARNPKRFLPVAMGGVFLVIFLGTSFGNDGTGRYLLPLYLLVALLAAELIRVMKARSRWLAAAALGCALAFNLGATIAASFTEPAGMTAQLDGRLQFGNQHDTDLITFLKQEGGSYGYSNYWVAYKITFLSDEEVVIAPRLSYKADLSNAWGQDRYPAYSLRVDRSPEPPFYVTSNQPELDERLRHALDIRQIDYREKMIGAYHVFYDLSVSVTPEELDLSVERGETAGDQ